MELRSASLLAAAFTGIALTACGDEPDQSNDDTGSSTAASDFLPCIVSDAGGFDDKSFNQLSFEGSKQAADELGVKLNSVESNSVNDYGPNLESLVAEDGIAIESVNSNSSSPGATPWLSRQAAVADHSSAPSLSGPG